MDFAENLKLYANVRTVSIAFPSSIFDNTPTPQLEAYLVGQIARAAVIFNVTEIIIFNEPSEVTKNHDLKISRLIKLFEYAECPQYLRKSIFGIEPDLKFAGLINPLEAQHHLRTSQLDCPYREGATTRHAQLEHKGKSGDFTEVNVGLNQTVAVPGTLELNVRVTLQLDPADLKKVQSMLGSPTKPHAIVVPPVEPYEKLNLYWGYYVREAKSLTDVWSTNVFTQKANFYDLIIGTSERGTCVDETEFRKRSVSQNGNPKKKPKHDFNHILVVFGGVRGLEFSAKCDESLGGKLAPDLFDYWINVCPNQGSTTIRTEEAILVTLSALRPKLNL